MNDIAVFRKKKERSADLNYANIPKLVEVDIKAWHRKTLKTNDYFKDPNGCWICVELFG
jgi:hypothetical protein